jgi:hypothetical protein
MRDVLQRRDSEGCMMATFHCGDCSTGCDDCALICAEGNHEGCIGTDDERAHADELRRK